jgi:hypothetical protein
MWRVLVVFVVAQQGQAANTANINFESYDVCCVCSEITS